MNKPWKLKAKSQRINLSKEMKGKTIRKLTFQSQVISKHVRPSNTSKYQWSREQITVRKLGMSQIPTSLPDFREYAKQILRNS